MNKKLLSLIFVLVSIFVESINAQTVLTSNKIGTIDGFLMNYGKIMVKHI